MSTEREGALAEIAFHWSQFDPRPSKPAALHRITLTARRTIRLLRADLVNLGVDWARYGEICYERSQAIGPPWRSSDARAFSHLRLGGNAKP